MTQLTFSLGPGATSAARVSLGCSVTLFDQQGRILLQRRSDGDWWCLPGGRVEPGDTFISAAKREAKEETGLDVEIVRLLGCYTDPEICAIYPDGNHVQIASLNFLVRRIGGDLIGSNEETVELRWFGNHELPANIIPTHRERIRDLFDPDHTMHID